MDLTRTSDGKTKKIILLNILILIIAGFVSICVGKFSMSPATILKVLSGKGTNLENRVFFMLRLPRTIMAVMAGAGLGLSGYVYQTVFKNPLASPDVIGISSGANLGSAMMIVIFGSSLVGIAVGAFLGGILAVISVIALVRATRSNSTSTYVLSGIIISSVASALIMLLKFCADNESDLARIEYWTMGSLSAVTLSKVLSILPFWIIGFVFTIMLNRQIGLLNLNEDEAKALGVRVKPIRILVLGISTLLVSSIICITGLISFAGLISPHIVALMLERKNNRTMILSAIIGAEVLLVSDILCRSVSTTELPLSILTTIIGVPFLIVVMVKRKRKNG